MDDRQFIQLLDRFGLSWRGYRKVRKGVKKRISRHMQQLGINTMDDYIGVINGNPEIATMVERLMTVSISRFFRDRPLWHILEHRVIPDITRTDRRRVDVWSAGCALGQEAYSFKILWTIIKRQYDRFPELRIWATDINPDYLKRSMHGVYDTSTLKGMPPALRDDFFHADKDTPTYRITEALKQDITWEIYDLIRQAPPAGKFRIIFLRNNLLTYYRDEIKAPAFQKIVDGLSEGGYLIIGTREKLPIQTERLHQLEDCPSVFQKIRSTRSQA